MNSWTRLLMACLLIPALVGGCGSSKNNDDGLKGGDFFGDDLTANSSSSMMDLLVRDSRFEILAQSLFDADLAATLDRQGSLTLFAPTDAAFERLPLRTRRILARNPRLLRELLLAHISSSEYTRFDLENRGSVRTLQGAVLRLRRQGGSLFVGGSRMTQFNGVVSNGVVHVVNEVIVPRNLRDDLRL